MLIDRKKAELELDEDAFLDIDNVYESIVKAGKARLRPVLLTAITTILGLIQLAVGFNINFSTWGGANSAAHDAQWRRQLYRNGGCHQGF